MLNYEPSGGQGGKEESSTSISLLVYVNDNLIHNDIDNDTDNDDVSEAVRFGIVLTCFLFPDRKSHYWCGGLRLGIVKNLHSYLDSKLERLISERALKDDLRVQEESRKDFLNLQSVYGTNLVVQLVLVKSYLGKQFN